MAVAALISTFLVCLFFTVSVSQSNFTDFVFGGNKCDFSVRLVKTRK